MSDEERTLRRRHLIFYLEVFDVESGDLVGHVVDITTKGVKLVSREPLETGKDFKLRMALPEGYFTQKELEFEAKSLWCTNDVNPDFFDTGFEFSDTIDSQAADVILTLIEDLGFNQ